jgi:hypothetical protein
MNGTAQKQVLNEAFKRFQRLPDWPLAVDGVTGVHVAQRNKPPPRQKDGPGADAQCHKRENSWAEQMESAFKF